MLPRGLLQPGFDHVVGRQGGLAVRLGTNDVGPVDSESTYWLPPRRVRSDRGIQSDALRPNGQSESNADIIQHNAILQRSRRRGLAAEDAPFKGSGRTSLFQSEQDRRGVAVTVGSEIT